MTPELVQALAAAASVLLAAGVLSLWWLAP